ncbi:hypothetical protein BO70DRAFT_361764 [Aspergillus heteromorphus CBS 117.55]|uniref:Uncharacterized protein n=1 Tax=Aspergillus heteromorphus CBS 117.55 TaxID=1448321 RepID=A0A317W9L5_9EURO|nr:uncharacterized protein BO70DRAFT_361764 [Aspergillus heteromorphus CBS 117.55]PWY82849.1 hypothetical protein BO70DRAFT_361764 [Aspergillus heteromorphus CBS 117.55]
MNNNTNSSQLSQPIQPSSHSARLHSSPSPSTETIQPLDKPLKDPYRPQPEQISRVHSFQQQLQPPTTLLQKGDEQREETSKLTLKKKRSEAPPPPE